MTERGRGLRLLDLTALVAAYGLAALLIRAFWPHDGPPSPVAAGFVTVAYVWLGLAMGGPLVLLIDRGRTPPPGAPASPRYTWAESAWLMIGAYWIGLALCVIPTRLPINPLLGVFPILAALLLRAFGTKRAAPSPAAKPAWTHAAALAVLATWPLAWLAMIALGGAL